MDLGARIAAWRKHFGLPQRDLAVAAGVTVSAVSYWESGKTTPTQANLAAIVEAFGLTMERFYGRVPKARAA